MCVSTIILQKTLYSCDDHCSHCFLAAAVLSTRFNILVVAAVVAAASAVGSVATLVFTSIIPL